MAVPFVKEFDFAYGRLDRLSPLVHRVICENPGPFTYTGSGTYLVGQKDIALIDPGPANDAHLAALLDAADKIGGQIKYILITHSHLDHCGGTSALVMATGAKVYGYSAHPTTQHDMPPALDEGGDPDFNPDIEMKNGDALSTDEFTIKAIHTPGHIANHLCFYLENEKALFTGDHIMGWATTVVAPPDGHMGDYFKSLDLLIDRAASCLDLTYYPTHGALITDTLPFVTEVKKHRQMRDDQIIAQLQHGQDDIMAMVAEMYKDVDKRLHIAAALNVKAHLDYMIESGKVSVDGQAGLFDGQYSLKK